MAKQRMLFVDDRTKRIHYAIEELGKLYDVTIAANVPETLRALSREDWDIVSLDFDLNGYDYNRAKDEKGTAAGIIAYIAEFGWPNAIRRTPLFRIHSSNAFAAEGMKRTLENAGLECEIRPIDYEPITKKRGKIGLTASAFDVIHPGYISLLKDARENCDYLIVAVHENPNRERKDKLVPVLSMSDRQKTLMAIRYVDEVVGYVDENGLRSIIKNNHVNIFIVGDDWIDKPVTGEDLVDKVYFHPREGWSATKFKKMIAESLK